MGVRSASVSVCSAWPAIGAGARDTRMSMVALPEAFDLADVDAFLRTRVSDANRRACMRVIVDLVHGKGATHKAKGNEIFLVGRHVVPRDDLEELRVRGAEWLPYRKGPDCLDKGHGWALNHPLARLRDYKRSRLLGVPLAPLRRRGPKRPRAPTEVDPERKQRLMDGGAITLHEYEVAKATAAVEA